MKRNKPRHSLEKPSAKQRMRASIYRRNKPIRSLVENLPVLILRRGGTSFVPASGMCPYQEGRLLAKLMMSSTYGKFGIPKKDLVFYADTDDMQRGAAVHTGTFVVPTVVKEILPDGRHRYDLKTMMEKIYPHPEKRS